MIKAYIILAHKNLKQLVQLLKRLDDKSSFFFIHIDNKLSDSQLLELTWLPDRVQLIERIDINWGEFSIVEATLSAMRAIKATNKEFNSIILLSGQDYPIKSNNYLNQFFRKSGDHIFMEFFKLSNYEKWSPGGGMFRVDKYFFGLKSNQLFFSRSLNFVCNLFPFLNRNQPEKLKHYAGSQWWMINMSALNYILEYVSKNPSYSRFHQGTFAPDELFF